LSRLFISEKSYSLSDTENYKKEGKKIGRKGKRGAHGEE
jgi:hypothetical protein